MSTNINISNDKVAPRVVTIAAPLEAVDDGMGNFLVRARPGRLSKSVAGSANVTLSLTEAANLIHEYTGTIGGDINVVLPLADGMAYIIHNKTTGAHTLTVIGATGTGIVVATNKTAIVYCDGTNFNRVTADT